MRFNGMRGGGLGMNIFGGFILIGLILLLLIAVSVLIYFVVKLLKNITKLNGLILQQGKPMNTDNTVISGNMTGNSTSSAMNILNERYAKGEISEEEYNAKKASILKY